jgi:hypothetical protein
VSYEFQRPFGTTAPSGFGIFGISAILATSEGGSCAYGDPNAPIVAGFAITWQ